MASPAVPLSSAARLPMLTIIHAPQGCLERTRQTQYTAMVAVDHPLLCREDVLLKFLARNAEVSPELEILS